MFVELSKLSGKEKKHYFALEDLFAYSFGKPKGEERLCNELKETVSDWKKMMGGRNSLEGSIMPYLEGIMSRDKEKGRNLYFFLSPIFFYIHILYEISRNEWRNAMSWSGIYCERVVRNMLREIDRRFSTNIYEEMRKSRFEDKNGKLKSELERRGFKLANELFSLMEIMYSLRSTTGPHDVPPPEPIRAQISASQCLPVYIDYLEALIFLGNDLTHDYRTFLSFFSNLTETKISLAFGEEERRISVTDLLKNVLYREGFFREGRKFKEAMDKMREMGYTFSESLVAQALRNLSKGKDAVLTRKGKQGRYIYYERYPPEEFFKSTI